MRGIVAVPLLLAMVSFALSNRDAVSLDLFPFGRLPFEPPLSLALLAAMGLGFFLGGLRVWIADFRHRRAARRAEEEIRLLETKHRELQSRPSGAYVAPPA